MFKLCTKIQASIFDLHIEIQPSIFDLCIEIDAIFETQYTIMSRRTHLETTVTLVEDIVRDFSCLYFFICNGQYVMFWKFKLIMNEIC